ncbi:AcrR family transcriptional regulator [Oxalobacteraceae bacterium GrIS 2.11]
MINNSAKNCGRPRNFDESDALEKATKVFRSKGYDGVTIDDLVAGMGVGRPSLYAIFGNKQALFLRVLKMYTEKNGALVAKALLSPLSLRESLAGFLRAIVDNATEEQSAPGCLAGCVAPLVNDEKVREILHNAAGASLAHIELRLRDGISAGEIPADFPVEVRASQIMDLARGLTMRAQLGIPRKTLLKDAAETVDLLLPPVAENN